MPARIVTVEKNQVAWGVGLHLAEYTLILIFENSGRTRAGYRSPPGNCGIFQNQRIRIRKIRAQQFFQGLPWRRNTLQTGSEIRARHRVVEPVDVEPEWAVR